MPERGRAPSAEDAFASQTSPRTDLAIEAHELAVQASAAVDGIDTTVDELDGIRVSRMHVRTKEAERRIQKRRGRYVTIEVPGLRRRDRELQERVAAQLAAEVKRFLSIADDASVLVVGLGNVHVTPDALGPMVVDRLFVTRHLFSYMPKVLGEGYRTVSAFSPGVLGVTGIETSEIVQGIVERVKPDAVIAVDALAARSLDRVNSTIQISDTGIQPGSGVGNKRKAIDQPSLGVPCVAIGVPTVVDAATIAGDAIELVLEQLRRTVPGNSASELFDQFSPAEKWQMIRELLEPLGNNLMVTPKEIDEFIEDVAVVVAKGLNLALHPAMTMDDANALTH
ncbi:MAG: GPR endopeptidase [Alicyclobacillaceae bacterium]|nr:GPR endopeptidase [Alicyclobacillaceae bacterium]